MPSILFRLNVEDYARWKPVFDEHSATRKDMGSKGGQLFRDAGDPNQVVVLMEWDNLERARQFTQSDVLREAMQRSGVSGQPDVYFLDEVERPAA